MCAARGSRLVIEYLTTIVKSLNGEAIDSDGATALHHAAISGHPDVITALSIIPEIKLDATDKVSSNIQGVTIASLYFLLHPSNLIFLIFNLILITNFCRFISFCLIFLIFFFYFSSRKDKHHCIVRASKGTQIALKFLLTWELI